ncbi:GatB/YqeY domain-containing protein [Cryptosporangium minutisporangium]
MSTAAGGLKTRLSTDLTTAMKARDELVTSTLRMALTAIRNEEVAGKAARELSDDEVLRVLTREAKKRVEAAEAFASGGRADRADRERAEGEVLSRYLPTQLGDEELSAVVAAALGEAGVTDVKQMGKAMKAVQAAVAGRAQGGRVAAEVKRQLSA